MMKVLAWITAANAALFVFGAGLTGLALAIQLQAFSARFRIIDRLHDRTHESRALGVHAERSSCFRCSDYQQSSGESQPVRGHHNQIDALVVRDLDDAKSLGRPRR
jgi:2-polyprenyl-6-methoxyphenol hydroxylase-like FAD-dependent oxidoreductase